VGALLNPLVDLDEILYGGDDIEYYLDYILYNPVALTISKWWTCKLEVGATFEPIGGFG
jgi:hypothetical protein